MHKIVAKYKLIVQLGYNKMVFNQNATNGFYLFINADYLLISFHLTTQSKQTV